MVKKDFWKNRRVLVTGHEGFLGAWLAKTLIEKGARVVGLDLVKNRKDVVLDGYRSQIVGLRGDIADIKTVRRILNRYQPQTIFHVAAEAIVGTANKNPLRTFQSNIQGTWNILEAARHIKSIQEIVVASSDKAYGSHKKLPYHESMALQGEHPYDVSKSCADLLCQAYFKTFQVPVCITRCGNIYGPGDYNFSRLVPDAIRHVLRNKQFMIRSDGTFTRDYIYVKDIVDGYVVLAEQMKSKKLFGQAFNFSYEKPFTVLEFLDLVIQKGGGRKIPPKILNQAQHEIRDQYLSSNKARQILGWRPEHSVEDGLKETIAWNRHHYRIKSN